MTRLANLYRVARGAARPFYLVDLPGYGYARGGRKSAQEFDALTASLFAADHDLGAVLVVDARHPGLAADRAAWTWMTETVAARAIVATKIDKLARGQRIRALAKLESVFEHPVAAVSAVTGEGLNELWKLIARMTNPA